MHKELEFMECDTCKAKPGSPQLCNGCLHNRNAIHKMQGVYWNRFTDIRNFMDKEIDTN